ncbi:hypothetical protein KBD08_03570 [Candidatus Babeliales bacterium]|nr:hypothetical protein [Candidatus Babeliales bacterium]
MKYVAKKTILFSLLTLSTYAYAKPTITQQLLNILCCCCMPTSNSYRRTAFYAESDPSIPLQEQYCTNQSPQSPRSPTPPELKQPFKKDLPENVPTTSFSTNSSFDMVCNNPSEL